jgi:hypothetical protein
VGDLDGDGLQDLLIGGASDDTYGDNAGGAYLIYGASDLAGVYTTDQIESAGRLADAGHTLSAANCESVHGAVLYGSVPDEQAGLAVAGGADVNGDGYADVLIGAAKARNGGGEARLVFGGPYGTDVPSAVGAAWAATLDVDGDPGDWSSDVRLETTSGSGTGAVVTWDADNVYLGFDNPDVASGGASHFGVVYLGDGDADGDPTGRGFHTQQPGLPFASDRRIVVRADGGYDSFDVFSGGAWASTSLADAGVTEAEGTVLELAVPRALLGGDRMELAVVWLYEGAGFETSFHGVPAEAFAGGTYDPDVSAWLSFELNRPTAPSRYGVLPDGGGRPLVEEDYGTWYLDADGDGQADQDRIAYVGCEMHKPATCPGEPLAVADPALATDCDDADPDVYAGHGCGPALCVGDATTGDSDGDGWCDDLDRCPLTWDAQEDGDGDGVGDRCDPCPHDAADDSDGDGSFDSADLCLGDDAAGDTDGDGTCDDLDPCAAYDRDVGSALGVVDADDTCGAGNDLTASCGGGSASDDIAIRWTAPADGTFVFTTDGSSYDTTLHLRDGASCTGPAPELACDDDGGAGSRSAITHTVSEGDVLLVVVDGYSASSCGDYVLTIDCASGDGDGDGTCDDADLCFGDDATGDTDGDGVCDDGDPCPLDATDDTDGDGVCDSVDLCLGDDATGDSDGDGTCDDRASCVPFDKDVGSALGVVDADDSCSFAADYTATCGSGAGSEDVAIRWTAPAAGTYTFTTNGSSYDTTLHLRDGAVCPGPAPQLVCNDDGGEGTRSLITRTVDEGDVILVVVDGYGSSSCGDYVLTVDCASGDADGDGVCDDADPCPVDALDDSDGDGSCDVDDLCAGDDATGDSDGDGVCDDTDACPLSDPDDADGDGTCDDVDLCVGDDAAGDTDGDGVCDDADACPLDAPDDADGDGVCDSVDLCVGTDATGDSDGDGFCDDADVCPSQSDDQTDSDGDGAGDACDACPASAPDDADGDGICDDVDLCFGDNATGDTDGDGTCDDLDDADTDGDGITDEDEACYGTDPTLSDSDGDGLLDWEEITRGSNPLESSTSSNRITYRAEATIDDDDTIITSGLVFDLGDTVRAVITMPLGLPDDEPDDDYGLYDTNDASGYIRWGETWLTIDYAEQHYFIPGGVYGDEQLGFNLHFTDASQPGYQDYEVYVLYEAFPGSWPHSGTDPLDAFRLEVPAQDPFFDSAITITDNSFNDASATMGWFIADNDGDGLSNTEEVVTCSDPFERDTDGDGLDDDEELAASTDPRDPDTDGDGQPDGADPDPLVP